ncbi:RDD family protein [Streptomyces sp. NPDC048172]|uniref:RDD family protein n=1 Tax=Streptomyces sp. NPDC048172 TaxID=3365505 RepID=UPI003717E74B
MAPSGTSGEVPRSGYYPDPSIPGYIRYWNGSAWVPGTSRPEPREGEPMPEPPPGAAPPAAPEPPAGPALASSPASSASPPRRTEPEETGPVFLDEDDALPELRPGGGSAWQADAARQAGPDGEHEGRISWPTPEDSADSGRDDPRGDWGGDRGGDRARGGEAEAERPRAGGESEPPAGTGAPGTPAAPAEQGPQVPGQGKREHTVGLRRSEVLGTGGPSADTPRASSSPAVPGQGQGHSQSQGQNQSQNQGPVQQPSGQRVPGQGGASASASASAAPAATPARTAAQNPAVPQGPASAPASAANPGAPWQQQVQELAAPAPAAAPSPAPATASPAGAGLPAQPQSGGPDAVTPWRPPAEDPFASVARQERPAGLGKRLCARLVDLVLTLAVGGGVAFPFVAKATDHIDDKVDAVEQAGVTKQVWLIDGTTGGYLAIVLGALLVFGLLYEVLPTARWGKTLGKKLCGVTVLDVERQDPPTFGAALTRWLVYGVLGLLAVGVVNVLWCVFDKPWRQCWHDKVARTFVAGRPR